MNSTTKISLALALALPLAACGENKAAPSVVKDAAGKVEGAVGDVAKMAEAPLAEVTKSISELTTKAASLTGEKKTELEGLIKNITAKKDELMNMTKDMSAAGVKEKFNAGLADLKKMVEAAMAKVK
ncbi:MAG: hypothetical protein JNL28_06630 [Planctomycetes bacterium]|nr:hypothetical protein [Planctomycetota bacterium]